MSYFILAKKGIQNSFQHESVAHQETSTIENFIPFDHFRMNPSVVKKNSPKGIIEKFF